MPDAGSMLGYLSEGALEGLDDFGLAKDIAAEAKRVIQAYQASGAMAAGKVAMGAAAAFASEDIIASEDVERFLQTGSISEMAMNMNLARLAGAAAAASIGGPLAALAARAMMRNMPRITGNDLRDAYNLATNTGLRSNRAARKQRDADRAAQGPPSAPPGGVPPTEPSGEADPDEAAPEEGAPEDTQDALPGQLPPPGARGQGTGTVAPEGPVNIGAELDRQKQAAKNGEQAPPDSQLLEDAIAKGDDTTGKELEKAGDALPDKLPEIPKLPLQLPGDRQSAGEAEGEQERGEAQQRTPQERAAELDRQKHASRTEQGASAAGEEDDDEEKVDIETEGDGTSGDPRPGSLLYLDWEFAACIPALFVFDFEPLLYIHEHFFGYYLMPDLPLLAMYMGFGKSEYDKPNTMHLVLFGMIILFELTLLAVAVGVFLLPLLIALFPAIIGASAGSSAISGLVEGTIFEEAFGDFFSAVRSLF